MHCAGLIHKLKTTNKHKVRLNGEIGSGVEHVSMRGFADDDVFNRTFLYGFDFEGRGNFSL